MKSQNEVSLDLLPFSEIDEISNTKPKNIEQACESAFARGYLDCQPGAVCDTRAGYEFVYDHARRPGYEGFAGDDLAVIEAAYRGGHAAAGKNWI